MKLFELADLAIPKGTRLSKATVGTYRRAFDKFVLFLADEESSAVGNVAKLTVDDFIAFARWLAEGEYAYSARSRTVYNSAVKHLMNAAILGGHMALAPADDLRYKMAIREYAGKIVRVPKLPKREWVDWTVGAAVADANDHLTDVRRARDAAILCFLRATGCRAAELTTLTLDNLDMEGWSASVVGKGDKSRTVFFDDVTSARLVWYWGLRGVAYAFELAFTVGRTPRPISTATVRRAVDTYKSIASVTGHPEMLGRRLTPHMFRHSFATEMLERTGNLAAVQDMLGHASPATTRVYAQISKAALRKVYDEGTEKGI